MDDGVKILGNGELTKKLTVQALSLIHICREAAIRALQACGIDVTSIRDVTPVPHNGCLLYTSDMPKKEVMVL